MNNYLLGVGLFGDDNLLNAISKTQGNFLEIGCLNGHHIYKVSKKFPDKIIYGIDPFISDGHVGIPENTPLIEQKINLYKNIDGISNIKFFEMTTENFVTQQQHNLADMNISFIVIDGAHIFDFIKIDIDLAVSCITSNKWNAGTIVMDDIHISDVVLANEYFLSLCKTNNIQLSNFRHTYAYYCYDVKVCQ